MLSIDKLKEQFKNKEYEQSLYSSKDEDGNDVVVMIGQYGFNIHTNQPNGWIRVDSYEYDEENDTWFYTESYNGKWK